MANQQKQRLQWVGACSCQASAAGLIAAISFKCSLRKAVNGKRSTGKGLHWSSVKLACGADAVQLARGWEQQCAWPAALGIVLAAIACLFCNGSLGHCPAGSSSGSALHVNCKRGIGTCNFSARTRSYAARLQCGAAVVLQLAACDLKHKWKPLQGGSAINTGHM